LTHSTSVSCEFVERRWTSADGLALSARDYAGVEGPVRLPVICLHGLTRNARDFEAVAPAIAASGRRVLVPDVRGRGRSAWDALPARYAPPIYAADVAALAYAAGVGRAVFVGTSMGGLITMALAATQPTLVAAAVLNDVGPEIAPEGLARIMRYAGVAPPAPKDWSEAAAYAARTNGEAFPHYGDHDWLAFARRLFRETEDRGLVLDYDPAITTPLVDVPTGPIPDIWPLFETLAMGRPLLLVRGATSDILKEDAAMRMQLCAPLMKTATAAGVGHAPMLTEADVAPALIDFLSEID
jgi:pimeloyl-ACP methyl ester carboxylesterase